MIIKNAILLVFTLALISNACNTKNGSGNGDSSTSANAYFGQQPPGLIPEIFAPGTVSVDGRFEGGITFSSELTEMYFGASYEDETTAIYFSKLEGNEWTPIKKADFTKGKKKEEMHPFASPDGQRIYFTALDSVFADEKIWYVQRTENSWGEATLLDSPVNDDLVFNPIQARNGDLYYFNLSKFKTYYAPNQNGEYPEVQNVPLEIGHHAFVSPSQDYLIVTARHQEDPERKDNELYVCFKEQDGSWSKPINPGSPLNSDLDEKSPRITPDGQYLFFGRAERPGDVGLANIYWVSTEVIHKLRPVD